VSASRGVILYCDHVDDYGTECEEFYATSAEWPDHAAARNEAADYGWTYVHSTDWCRYHSEDR